MNDGRLDTEELIKDCVQILKEKKAENTVVLNISKINSCFDYFVITTGSSGIHCKAIAGDIVSYMEKTGNKIRSKPDTASSWIVLDYNDTVFHIFSEDTRAYYQLEQLWADGERLTFE